MRRAQARPAATFAGCERPRLPVVLPPRARTPRSATEPFILLVEFEVCRHEGGAGATYSLQYSVSANLLIDPVRPLSRIANNLADVCSRHGGQNMARERAQCCQCTAKRLDQNVVDWNRLSSKRARICCAPRLVGSPELCRLRASRTAHDLAARAHSPRLRASLTATVVPKCIRQHPHAPTPTCTCTVLPPLFAA